MRDHLDDELQVGTRVGFEGAGALQVGCRGGENAEAECFMRICNSGKQRRSGDSRGAVKYDWGVTFCGQCRRGRESTWRLQCGEALHHTGLQGSLRRQCVLDVLVLQDIFDRAETPAVDNTREADAVDHPPGEDRCTEDAGKVVAELLFVGNSGENMIEVGVVHSETIAKALTSFLDGEEVVLGVALDEEHLGEGGEGVAALHELL